MSLAEGHLAFVCLRLGLGRPEVAAALRLRLPQAAEDEPAFLQELASFLIANRIPAGVRVTLGVPRADFILRRFETPPVKPASLAELVGFEAERHLPGRRDEFLLGWKVGGRTAEGGYTVVLGAARRQALERASGLLARANLAPYSIQPEPVALAAAVRAAAPEARRALVLDVGPSSVGVDLVDEGAPVSSRVFAVEDAAWKDSFASPQPPGGEGGQGDGSAERRHEATVRVGAMLVERLGAPVFKESLPGGGSPELLLIGPGAARSRLVGALQAGLGVPVRAVALWPLVRWGSPPADLAPLTTALALALAGRGRRARARAGRGAPGRAAPRPEQAARRSCSRSCSRPCVAAHLAGAAVRQQRRLALVDGEIRALKARLEKVETLNRHLQGQRARRRLPRRDDHAGARASRTSCAS